MADNLDESLKKLRDLKNRPDGVTSKEWSAIRKGLKDLQDRKDKPFDPVQHKAITQSDLAKLFIKLYFGIMAGVLIYVPFYNWSIVHFFGSQTDLKISVRDAFMMVSSTITPLLAFVLGHYFKGRD